MKTFEGHSSDVSIDVCIDHQYLYYAEGASNGFKVSSLNSQMSESVDIAGMYSRSTPAVVDGIAYICSAGSIGGAPGHPGICAITVQDFKKMERIWGGDIEYDIPEKDRQACFSSPSVWDGKVYIGMDSGFFYAYNAKIGTTNASGLIRFRYLHLQRQHPFRQQKRHRHLPTIKS